MEDPIKQDFRKFLFILWKFLNLPEPTPIQYDIALYLQHGPRRKVIEGFRGVAKSWITAAYVLWRLYNDIDLKVLVVSASGSKANEFSTFIKKIIMEWDFLAHLRPVDPEQRWSNISFDVGNCKPAVAPSVKSVGITGQITGSRADLIVPDDIESLNNSLTATMRERIAEAVKEFDAVLVPGGEIDFLGTPQVEDSLYAKLPGRGYDVRVWPGRFPDSELVERMGHLFAPWVLDALARDPSIVGKPTDPSRFSTLDLSEREASYGRSGFRMQFMLDSTGADHDKTPLKLADLMVMGLDPKMGPERAVWSSSPESVHPTLQNPGLPGDKFYRPMWVSDRFVDFTMSVMTIDPAGRGKDEASYCVAKELNGIIYVIASGGFLGGYEKSLEALALIAKQYDVNKIIVEGNFGDGMFTSLLKPHLIKHHQCEVEEIKHSGQKELRIIDTLEPVFNQHRLVLDEALILKDLKDAEKIGGDYSLLYQMTRITKERGSLRHDDRLEALAMAVAYWIEQMSKDTENAADKSRERALRRELKEFSKGVLIRPAVNIGSIPRRRKNFLFGNRFS